MWLSHQYHFSSIFQIFLYPQKSLIGSEEKYIPVGVSVVINIHNKTISGGDINNYLLHAMLIQLLIQIFQGGQHLSYPVWPDDMQYWCPEHRHR